MNRICPWEVRENTWTNICFDLLLWIPRSIGRKEAQQSTKRTTWQPGKKPMKSQLPIFEVPVKCVLPGRKKIQCVKRVFVELAGRRSFFPARHTDVFHEPLGPSKERKRGQGGGRRGEGVLGAMT